jgi:hypothetical protein
MKMASCLIMGLNSVFWMNERKSSQEQIQARAPSLVVKDVGLELAVGVKQTRRLMHLVVRIVTKIRVR